MLKKITMRYLLFILLFGTTSSFAQNKIMGYVKLQSSGKTALPNVEVHALGAKTTYTNDKGFFELEFAKKKVGDVIGVIEFSLDGYRLLNEEKCEGNTISSDPTLAPLVIVMCKAKEYRTQKAAYYDIIVNNVENNFKEERKQLQAQIQLLSQQIEKNADNAELEKERRILLSEINNLENEKEQILERAEKLAEQFATIDLDGASQMAKDALELFKQGKVKAAIALMDDEVMDKNMQAAKKAQSNHQAALIKADSAIQQGVKNYMIKARMLKVDLKWSAVYNNYIKAIEGDSTNVNHLWEVADFMDELNDQKDAIQLYKQALRQTKSEFTKSAFFNNLGNQYQYNNQYKKAEKAYLNALKIKKRLAKNNAKRFEPEVALTQNNLGVLYIALNQYKKAEKAYLNALEIHQRLAKNNEMRFEPEVAMTQNNLGVLYKALDQYEKAEKAFLNALEIRKRLAKNNEIRFESEVAMTQNNLGLLYKDLKQYKKAEKAFLNALEIRKRLAKNNEVRFEPEVALTQNNLGLFYYDLNQYKKAEKAFLNALEIRKRLAKNNTKRFEPDVAMTQNNLGNFYKNLNQYKKAEKAYLNALEIYQRLAKNNTERFEPDVAMTQNNLGIFYSALNQYEKAEKAYLNALEIRKQLAKNNAERFEPDVANTQNNLGLFYYALNQYEKADAILIQSITTYRKLVKKNAQRYELPLAGTLIARSLVQIELKNIEDAKQYLLEAQVLAEKYPQIPAAQIYLSIIKKELDKILSPKGNTVSDKIFELEEKIKNTTDNKEKANYQTEIVELLEQLRSKNPANEKINNITANEYGSLAWYLLFTQEFAKAETAARTAIEMSTEAEWVNTNLALALLYQGKLEKAKAIYLELKDKPYGKATYQKVFLEDLDALEEKGITHPDVEKIRALLKE